MIQPKYNRYITSDWQPLFIALLICLFSCTPKTEQNNDPITETDTQIDTAYYNIDYHLIPDHKYSINYRYEYLLDIQNGNNKKSKWNPRNWKKEETTVVSVLETYTIKTHDEHGQIGLVMTLDSTILPINKNYLGIYGNNKPYEKIGEGITTDGKEITLSRIGNNKLPSTLVWSQQEQLPHSKMRIGDTYTSVQPYYNNYNQEDTIVYTLAAVKDSIAYLGLAPRQRIRSIAGVEYMVNITGEVEYDLRKNYFSKSVSHESSVNSLNMGGKTITIKKNDTKEYTIAIEEIR